MEKLKVFAARINDLCVGFESFLGYPLDQMPDYDLLMAEPPAREEPLKGAQCPYRGLSREHTMMWYARALSDYVHKLQTGLGEGARRDLSSIEWQDVIRIQVLFTRVLPRKEHQLFNRALTQSED